MRQKLAAFYQVHFSRCLVTLRTVQPRRPASSVGFRSSKNSSVSISSVLHLTAAALPAVPVKVKKRASSSRRSPAAQPVSSRGDSGFAVRICLGFGFPNSALLLHRVKNSKMHLTACQSGPVSKSAPLYCKTSSIKARTAIPSASFPATGKTSHGGPRILKAA